MAAALAFPQGTALWLDVPFVRQSAEGCGAASLAMVMQYWESKQSLPGSAPSDAATILRRLRSPQAHGIYASAMERYLKDHGFQTFAFAGKWDDIEEQIGKGRPLIVALRPTGNGKVLHYVVVAGVDNASGLVMFNDPAGRKLTKLDRKRFEKEWNATNQWTLLALPKNSAPQSP